MADTWNPGTSVHHQASDDGCPQLRLAASDDDLAAGTRCDERTDGGGQRRAAVTDGRRQHPVTSASDDWRTGGG
jgi:hypothetical protein